MNYKQKKKALEAYKEKVACVITYRRMGMSFQAVADRCKTGDRTNTHKIYKANRLDPEFKGL